MKLYTRLAAGILTAAFVAPAFAADTATTFSDKAFTDVPTSSPYYDAIEYLRTNNVLKGYDDGTFRPNATINRAEFVKLITNPFIIDTNRMNECLTSYDGTTGDKIFFKDVPKNSWYAAEVCHAKDKNIISGYLDGTFRPENETNFAETAKIIAGVFAYQVMTETAPWYKPYVERLAELHAIPTSITRFDKAITRGEMAEMIYRLKADVQTKSTKTYGQIK